MITLLSNDTVKWTGHRQVRQYYRSTFLVLLVLHSTFLLPAIQLVECNLRIVQRLDQTPDQKEAGSLRPVNSYGYLHNLVELEGINNEYKSEAAALEPLESATQASYWSKLKGLVRTTIAPARSYIALVSRFHRWFKNYNALQKASSEPMMDALDVLREEYAKVDETLAKEELLKLQKGEDLSKEPVEVDPKKIETVDFIFKALHLVIERLEEILREREAKNGGEIVDVDTSETSEELEVDSSTVDTNTEVEQQEYNDERVKKAMDRAKRSVINTAKRVAMHEAVVLAKLAAYNSLAKYMSEMATTPGDPLNYLTPLVLLMGSASTPLAVSYIRDLEFRAALAVVSHINPMPSLKRIVMGQTDKAQQS